MTRLTLSNILLVILLGCTEEERTLPYFGEHTMVGADTSHYRIPEFTFNDHHGEEFTEADLDGHIVVAEFFFTHCPTICPVMTTQMKRLSATTGGDDLVIVSHTIDPERDTLERLQWYAENNAIDDPNWHFVYGPEYEINALGNEGYMINAMRDEAAPGGYAHSQFFILLDKERHIRGYYDGTTTEEVDQLIKDIELLRNER